MSALDDDRAALSDVSDKTVVIQSNANSFPIRASLLLLWTVDQDEGASLAALTARHIQITKSRMGGSLTKLGEALQRRYRRRLVYQGAHPNAAQKILLA